VTHALRSAAPGAAVAPGQVPPSGRSAPHRIYLRRYSAQPGRRRHGRWVALFAVLGSLLFAKVWECTVANSLSMERDRLTGEVRALENRIRLSSELRDQAALGRGIDSETLREQGFVNPEPSRIIEIDLSGAGR